MKLNKITRFAIIIYCCSSSIIAPIDDDEKAAASLATATIAMTVYVTAPVTALVTVPIALVAGVFGVKKMNDQANCVVS